MRPPIMRILTITQELQPYVELSSAGHIVRNLLPYLRKANIDVRILVPRYHTIHAKKNKLHDVVRLSGMNIIMGKEKDDYTLNIKVTTLPDVRYQVYFLDNDDLFRPNETLFRTDGTFLPDNGLRMVFFARSALEMLLKLGWQPDVLHCHGWFTTLIPFYLNRLYRNEPIFKNTRILLSIYDDFFVGQLEDLTEDILQVEADLPIEELKPYVRADYPRLYLHALKESDGLIFASPYVDPDLTEAIRQQFGEKILLTYSFGEDEKDFLQAHIPLYKKFAPTPEPSMS